MTTQASAPPAAVNTPLTVVRQGAQANGLYTKLFTQGANGVSAAQITMLLNQSLKLAGINLPVGAQITLDSAQIILAGGAFANDLAIGAATLQCVGDLSTGIAGASQLLSTLGLIDHTAADFIGLGANLALALASGGANVLADIGVIISLIACVGDIGPLFGGNQAAATAMAKQALAKQVQAKIAPQVANAASLVALYAQGKLDMFDMIGQVALNDPTQFATLFPGLATFFPSYIPIKLVGQGSSSGWFSTKTDTETETFYSLLTTKQQIEDILVSQYLTAPMAPFESFETVAPVVTIQALSVLALIMQSGGSGDTVINFGFDMIGAMRALSITPAILGDDWLFKGLQRNETDLSDWQTSLPYAPLTLPWIQPVTSATTVNGVNQLSPAQTAQNSQAAELVALQKLMQQYDQAGDIESLMLIPEAVAMLDQYAAFYVAPVFYTTQHYNDDVTAYNTELQNLQGLLIGLGPNDQVTINQVNGEIAALKKPSIVIGEITNMRLSGTSITTQNWYSSTMSTDPSTAQGVQFWTYVNSNYTIDLSDYWKILNVLSTMQKSQLFKDDAQVQDFTASLTAIESRFSSAYSFVIAKQLNIRARAQVAQNLGIDPSLLASRYDSNGNLIFYQKKAS